MADINKLSALTIAVATKPAGQEDSEPIYARLDTWIFKQGYAGIGWPCEKFLANPATGDYARLKSEIMIPVTKISADD